MILLIDPYHFVPHRQTKVSPPSGAGDRMSRRTISDIYIFLIAISNRVNRFFEINGWATPTRPCLRPLEWAFIFRSCRCAADGSSRSSSTTPM